MACLIEREGNVSHSGSSVVEYVAISDELIETLPVLSVPERSESKYFHLEMEIDVCNYNVTYSWLCHLQN